MCEQGDCSHPEQARQVDEFRNRAETVVRQICLQCGRVLSVQRQPQYRLG